MPSRSHLFADEELSRADQESTIFLKLLEAAPDPMMLVADDGRIVLANAQVENVFGYTREDCLGKSVELFVPEAIRHSHVGYRSQYFSEPRTRPMGVGLELNGQRKDGSLVPVEISLSPLTVDGKRFTVCIARDITEAKQNRDELEKKARELARSNAELECFAYVASHDLQEPLRMVASYTQLLQRRYAGRLDADADEFIAYAVDGVARMQMLIEDLLTYSRVTRKDRPLVEVDMNRIVAQVLANLEVAIEERAAVIEVAERLPVVCGDAVQLSQLLQNLIVNALKFKQPECTPIVQISCEDLGEIWRFTVKDNGIGIEGQYHAKIFELFQRLHSRHEYEGTGIGLSLCKRIAERHGGQISLDSKVGEGSWFFIDLPKHLEEYQ